jgi:hypothetical protein
MALGPLARFLIWFLRRCPNVSLIELSHNSRPQHSPADPPTVWGADPEALSQELRDPYYRQAYIDHLEACHAMPASQFRK